MIQFNELKVAEDGNSITITAEVLENAYYDNVYLDRLIIDSQDTYTGTGPSGSPLINIDISKDINLKYFEIVLEQADILVNINSTLFFVYVTTKGAPAANTPCGEDISTTLGVIANMYPFYQKSIYFYAKEFTGCDIPKKFINFILQYKALLISVQTGNYPQSIVLWNKYFKKNKDFLPIKNCNCYGSNT